MIHRSASFFGRYGKSTSIFFLGAAEVEKRFQPFSQSKLEFKKENTGLFDL
jgi:hypothetical protein